MAAQPAPAQLASSLLSLELESQARISTGYADIDAALGGGLHSSSITAISGASGAGKTLLAFQVITTYLLAQPTSYVALVDTTGLFSPRWLFDTVCERLRSRPSPPSDTELDQEAISALDRVKVMRVFDLVGVVEALAEVRDTCGCKSSPSSPGEIAAASVQVETPKEAITISEASNRRFEEGLSVRRTEVPDSDEEGSVVSTEHGFPATADPSLGPKVNGQTPHQRVSDDTGLLVVDNLTTVVAAVTRSGTVTGNIPQEPRYSIGIIDRIDCRLGHALLTTFLRSLSHLAKHHCICVLLLNNAVGMRSRSPRRSSDPSLSHQPSESYDNTRAAQNSSETFRNDGDDISVFDSVPGRPALGKTFTHFVDVHVWLSQVPWTMNDSELIARGRDKRAKYIRVLEVLADKLGDRQDWWGGFGEGELLLDK
ncbi:MAG: hypothetical protein M1814_002893 [Vezdaea aestivalis]|nr:MAG: hypothetical protein M1814_002893 [Vezdaea aestivalis]